MTHLANVVIIKLAFSLHAFATVELILAWNLKRVLIVDDEVEITTQLKIGLKGYGFSISTSNNALDVLSNFRPGMYDLAIVDIRMPEMNGFELYRELRKIDSQLPIWFLTAFDIHVKEFESMFPDLDVNMIVRKPVSISDLARKINSTR